MIELDDVFVLYRGARHDVVALRGLSLTVRPGERVVVNGPSGSGKSTLVRVLTADVEPGAGRASVLGHDVAGLVGGRGVSRRSLIGIVTQGSGRDLAPELTCAQNVALQARLAGVDRATAASEAVGALERFRVAHLADRNPGTLSNGEAQRVAIAAALACRPGVIVADEPTGELDRANADLVYDLLAEQTTQTGACLLLVTHDAAANRIAHRVITIRDGRVSAERTDEVDALIVDGRGWVRLPDADRRRARIYDRAVVAGDTDRVVARDTDRSVVLSGVGGADPDVSTVKGTGSAGRSHSVEIVRAQSVSFTVAHTEVLAPATVVVRTGEMTALVGPSGSGKTTLLGLLGGLGVPTDGIIERAADCSVAIGTSLAGFAEHLSVRDNIVLARSVRGLSEADIMTTLAELGIDHLGDRPVWALSGGERQRVAIARAIASDADLVLLDEPTSQLDETSALRVATALAEMARAGRAIVCTTHDAAITQRADNIVTLG